MLLQGKCSTVVSFSLLHCTLFILLSEVEKLEMSASALYYLSSATNYMNNKLNSQSL